MKKIMSVITLSLVVAGCTTTDGVLVEPEGDVVAPEGVVYEGVGVGVGGFSDVNIYGGGIYGGGVYRDNRDNVSNAYRDGYYRGSEHKDGGYEGGEHRDGGGGRGGRR
jgi:hypothetical protein